MDAFQGPIWLYASARSRGTIANVKHLFRPAAAAEIKARIVRLRPESERQWGRMDVAQALAHCAIAFDMAMGRINPPRVLIGRVIGPVAKRSLITNGKPMVRNARTEARLVVEGERDFWAERATLLETIDRFVAAGPNGCTTHPHFFMGPMTPEEWAALMYQHLDHHLRQFGA
jgi:hypothetical protein